MPRTFNLNTLEAKVLCGLAKLYENCEEFRDTLRRDVIIKELGITDKQYDRAMPLMGEIGVIEIYSCMGDDIAATVFIHPIIVSKAADVKRQAKEQCWDWLPKLWWVIVSAVVGSAMTILTLWISGHLGIGKEETKSQNTSNTESAILQESDDGG